MSSNKAELDQLSTKLKEIVAQLYDLELTASEYPNDTANDFIHDKLKRLVVAFSELDGLKDSTTLSIPQDVLEYIEAGRNPNVYTRQFSEAVTRASQEMHGKMTAHRDFASVLGDAMALEYPELTEDIKRAQLEVVDGTLAKHHEPVDSRV